MASLCLVPGLDWNQGMVLAARLTGLMLGNGCQSVLHSRSGMESGHGPGCQAHWAYAREWVPVCTSFQV